jgi:hypothetical protein
MEAIHARWDDKRTPGRNTLARSIFNLNAEYADAMETLNALTSFYNHLPAAHQDLADGLAPSHGKPQKALAELGRLRRTWPASPKSWRSPDEKKSE